jgi:hypothetical protein
VVYGRDLPSLRTYLSGGARLLAVNNQLRDRDEFIMEVWERLEQGQQCYKSFYDRHHQDLEFTPWQWVLLRLVHWLIASLVAAGKGKLGPKFYGPFQVLERIGDVAYRLLPAGDKLHNVFHIGMLKLYHGEEPTRPGVLPTIRHGRTCLEPTSIVKSRLARGRHELLVQWVGLAAADATWVDLEEFRRLHPAL